MKQSKKSLGMKISAFVLSFAMVCTLLAGVNVVAFAADEDEVESTPVFCAYNQNNGEHFFTTNEAEYNHLVELTWGAEGEKWQAPVKSNSPIFRLYNQNSGEHYFTLDANEARSLASIGWNDEGIGLYSDDEKATPVYCMYNPNATGQFEAGAHHYTKDASEAAYLESIGWTWTNDGQAAFYGVKEEEPQILVKITKAEQKSANTVEVTFDQSAIGLVEKSDIVVAKADGTLVLPANTMELGTDGTTAVLTLAIPFEDGVDYVVDLNDSEAGFTASVGAPAYVTVPTASAQKGVNTPIEFTIYDSKGVDITSTIDVDSTCTVDVEYDDATVTTSPASDANITMNTVGEEAIVTVTYEDPEGEAADIVGKGTITCIPAEAVVGYPIYAVYDPESVDDVAFINPNNKMAKFYLSKQTTSTDPVSVEVGEESEVVYFSAANLSDFSIYSYDEYEIESSDDDIMSVAIYDKAGIAPANEGKQLAFKVSGNQVGTANVVVKATVNDVASYYNVPVKVTPKGKISTISYTVDKSTLSNAYDISYKAKSEVEVYDSNGKEITKDDGLVYSYEVTGGVEGAGTDDKGLDDAAKAVLGTDATGFTVSTATPADETTWYTAYGASSGKRTIKCTVTQGDVDKNKSIAINVQALPAGVWTGQEQTSVTYGVELTDASLFSDADKLGDDLGGTTARLATYVGGKFVGYVNTDNSGNIEIGDYIRATTPQAINITAKKAIANGSLKAGAKYGSKYALADQESLGIAYCQLAGKTADTYKYSLKELQATTGSSINMSGVMAVLAFNPLAVDQDTDANRTTYAYRLDNQDKMTAFARPGSYQIVFAWISAYDANPANNVANPTVQSATAKFSVGSAVQDIANAEVVNVKSRNVDNLTVSDIKDNIVARADMNNNESDTSVLDSIGIADKNYAEITDVGSDNTFFVKYAVVSECLDGVANSTFVNFYVPINTTFRTV